MKLPRSNPPGEFQAFAFVCAIPVPGNAEKPMTEKFARSATAKPLVDEGYGPGEAQLICGEMGPNDRYNDVSNTGVRS
jgi:hypothetical protein